jgi:hypothetical protein
MDILRRMAMAGMDGMATQAMVAMPLEDITGKGVDQISVEHRDAGDAKSSEDASSVERESSACASGEGPTRGVAVEHFRRECMGQERSGET